MTTPPPDDKNIKHITAANKINHYTRTLTGNFRYQQITATLQYNKSKRGNKEFDALPLPTFYLLVKKVQNSRSPWATIDFFRTLRSIRQCVYMYRDSNLTFLLLDVITLRDSAPGNTESLRLSSLWVKIWSCQGLKLQTLQTLGSVDSTSNNLSHPSNKSICNNYLSSIKKYLLKSERFINLSCYTRYTKYCPGQ